MEELLKDEHAGSISERVALRNALTTLADLQKVANARKPSRSVGRERGQAVGP
jgi:glycine betaine/choline ABC-type transport system substrate-binding protein